MTGLTVLVCGGRSYADREALFSALDAIHAVTPIERIVHGAASGADSLAAEWAASRNAATSSWPADWKTHGRAAGPIRNAAMLRGSKPDLVVAFPGGRGTADMVTRAKAAGAEVREVARDTVWELVGAVRRRDAALAALPVNEEDEAIVSRGLARRTDGTKRPLTRKAPK